MDADRRRPIDMLRWPDALPAAAIVIGVVMRVRSHTDGEQRAWIALAFFALYSLGGELITRWEYRHVR